jgi:hypothetical protein
MASFAAAQGQFLRNWHAEAMTYALEPMKGTTGKIRLVEQECC